MADSIPSLRRKLKDADAEIERLRHELMGKSGDTERIVKRETKIVEVPVDVERVVYKRFETERVVYVDNPSHIRTIELLQERLSECQNISQSDS